MWIKKKKKKEEEEISTKKKRVGKLCVAKKKEWGSYALSPLFLTKIFLLNPLLHYPTTYGITSLLRSKVMRKWWCVYKLGCTKKAKKDFGNPERKYT